MASYDFVALQEVHGEAVITRLAQKLEDLTGKAGPSLALEKVAGRGRYKENDVFLWKAGQVDYVGGAVLYFRPR